ncbi:zinc ribbon domain-containing protein [Comamonas suwonensis]|uniref:zinc ribbon domain-containing protein n=1 Tax=Comamonas suwonensis TaxID=2606214 RepID=UPI001F3FC997|nr:zinc ribbon domain-containing protein [Comamonas suwonensis]
MSKSLRLPEKWFRRGLWLVALAFAFFLIGLGGLVVGNLPQPNHSLEVESFIAQADAQRVQAEIDKAQKLSSATSKAQDKAQLKYDAERSRYQSARETFDNWIATRRATERPEQDAELIARTKALDELKQSESKARQVLEQESMKSLEASQALSAAESEMSGLRDQAYPQYQAAARASELRVFLFRLAITLPLLVLAGWLFAKKRKSTWWPFVWGFIFFALFAFFVELVPYLPDYGGYVRYIVGILVTVLLGRYAIVALNRYLEKQKLQEALPEVQRREELSYDVALERLAKSVCPGCERPVDLKNTEIDFCPHCGIGLFDHCGNCHTRKSAFARFCHSCGSSASKVFTDLTAQAAMEAQTNADRKPDSAASGAG